MVVPNEAKAAKYDVFKKNHIDIEQFKKWSEENPPYRIWYNTLLALVMLLGDIYKNSGNIETLTLERMFPYGIDLSTFECNLIIPEEYKKYNDDKFAYFLSIIPSNRHFWYLLNIKERIEFYENLKKYYNDKLIHVSKIGYTCGDLITDLNKYQIANDGFGPEPSRLKKELPNLVEKSLEPYRLITFDRIHCIQEGKDYKFYKYANAKSIKKAPVSLGQFIVNRSWL